MKIGDKVKVIDMSHKCFTKVGRVCEITYGGWLTVHFIDEKTGLETYACSSPETFEKANKD